MKLLIDVNIFVDVLRKRRGWAKSLLVLNKLTDPSITGFVSALTLPILYFLQRRLLGEREARREARWMTRDCQIVPLTEQILNAAQRSRLPDFEDAIQFHSAKEAQVDFIVTRNKRDFRQKQIAVVTPEELLKKLDLP